MLKAFIDRERSPCLKYLGKRDLVVVNQLSEYLTALHRWLLTVDLYGAAYAVCMILLQVGSFHMLHPILLDM